MIVNGKSPDQYDQPPFNSSFGLIGLDRKRSLPTISALRTLRTFGIPLLRPTEALFAVANTSSTDLSGRHNSPGELSFLIRVSCGGSIA